MTLDGLGRIDINVAVSLYAPKGITDNNSPLTFLNGRIYRNSDDDNIVIQLEKTKNSDYLFAGKPIFLFLAHHLGLYVVSAIINGRSVEGDSVILRCKKSRQIKFFQRRKCIRVSVDIPVKVGELEGSVQDIGIGGAMLKTYDNLTLGSIVRINYQLLDIGDFAMVGKVIRSFRNNGYYGHGIQFINPNENDLVRIAGFVESEQTRQKNLGLQIFKAIIFKAAIKVDIPAVLGIVQREGNLSVPVTPYRKCKVSIIEIGINHLIVETTIKFSSGTILEFSTDFPKLGHTVINGVVKHVHMGEGKFQVYAEYIEDYERIRDCILEELAQDFDITEKKCKRKNL